MESIQNVGILGLGVYLPETVRKNDWWPKPLVAKWAEKYAQLVPVDKRIEPRTEGERLVMQAVAEAQQDPFCGARERRIAPDEMLASEMEVAACRDALERAGVRTSEIDLLLVYSVVPDFLNSPNACAVHHKLGLANHCFSVSIDVACNSFLVQLFLAEQMIRGGQARRALLVQSSTMPRLLDAATPVSAWFGEGATAEVIGPVGAELGILGRARETEGTLHNAIVTSVPGKRWYEEGRNLWHAWDRQRSPMVIIQAPDVARAMVSAALADAQLAAQDVDFYATHQPTSWFGRVTKTYAGLDRARTLDTFPWAGNLSASNIPLVLATADREKMLRRGDVVAAYASGSGRTSCGLVMRWGH